MMAVRTRNRTMNFPAAVRGIVFHLRVACQPKRRPRFFVQRWGAIGDIICLQPSLAALRRQNPDAFIVFATLPEYIPLARMLQGVDVVLDARGADYYHSLTNRIYDLSVHPHYEDEKPTGLPRIHVIDDFSEKLEVTLGDRQPHLSVPPDLQDRLRPQLDALRHKGPLIAIQPGPSEPVRTWPEAHWAVLAQRLIQEQGATLVQLGADFHHLGGKSNRAVRVPGVTDWVNQLSVAETAAVLSLCDLFVGIDSGLLHMAGAVGTPGVGLFGPVNPSLRLAPSTPAIGVHASASDVPCLGCHHREPRLHWRTGCPHDVACMQVLHPDAAYDAVTMLLTNNGK